MIVRLGLNGPRRYSVQETEYYGMSSRHSSGTARLIQVGPVAHPCKHEHAGRGGAGGEGGGRLEARSEGDGAAGGAGREDDDAALEAGRGNSGGIGGVGGRRDLHHVVGGEGHGRGTVA